MSTAAMRDTWRSLVVMCFVGLVGVTLQGVVLRALIPEAPIPNLGIILVVFLAFYDPSVRGVSTAFFLGLLLDLSSAGLVGPFSAAFVVVFGFISSMSQRMFVESPLTTFFAVAFGTVLSRVVYAAVVFEFRPRESLFGGSFWFLLGEALITGILAPVIFGILRPLLLDPRRRGE